MDSDILAGIPIFTSISVGGGAVAFNLDPIAFGAMEKGILVFAFAGNDGVTNLAPWITTLDKKNLDVLESPQVRKRFKILRENHLKHCEFEAKLFEERTALEAKYQKLYQPLYTKRYDIVNGVEVEQTATETTKTEQEDEPTDVKGVPNFWLTALKNDEILAAKVNYS